jgi:hypothetical protein
MLKLNENKNKHYDSGGIETIDFIRSKLTKEQYQGYLLGNVLKYVSRCNYKGSAKSDIEKALQYLTWLNEEEVSS